MEARARVFWAKKSGTDVGGRPAPRPDVAMQDVAMIQVYRQKAI